MSTLPVRTRVHAFLRTFLLQAVWNYDRMQNVGFAFSMKPALVRLHARDAAPMREAVTRHLEYFNTHPYMATALVGASVSLEEQVARGERRPDEVTSFKNGIMGSYGAIGDSFFWAALKPFGAVIAVALVLTGAGASGPAIFVAGYGLVALAVRTFGFFGGVASGPMIVATLARLDFAGATRRLKMAAAAIAGLSAALWSAWFAADGPGLPLPAEWPLAALAFPTAIGLAGAARRGVSPAGAAGALAALLAAAGAWKGWG